MTDIRKIEQAIIRPTLMLEFLNQYEEDARKGYLIRDILLGISIALLFIQ